MILQFGIEFKEAYELLVSAWAGAFAKQPECLASAGTGSTGAPPSCLHKT